jgi:regulator of cell morphogenesis and NO signaling
MSVTTDRGPSQRRIVGEVAAATPGAKEVFPRFNLDFCCGSDVALDEAETNRGVDVTAVVRALDDLEASAIAMPVPFETGALIDHILTRYHETHRRALPVSQ